MKTKYLLLFTFALSLIFAGCSNDDEEDVYSGWFPSTFLCKINFYNADGTEFDISSNIDDVTDFTVTKCADRDDTYSFKWDPAMREGQFTTGNSLVVRLTYILNTEKHLDNVTWNLNMTSPEMFNTDAAQTIHVACNGTKEQNASDYITKVESDGPVISTSKALDLGEYQGLESYFLNINVTLPPAD